MSKRKLLIANWKLNHHRESAANFLTTLKGRLHQDQSLELAIAPVAPMLEFVGAHIGELPIALAAQNVFYEEKGAYTGEWGPLHLCELGVSFCIVGHSERRTIFHETDEVVAKKTKACLLANIAPVVCVGETDEQHKASQTKAVIEKQATAVLQVADNKSLIFAYEPLWAIGSGNHATPTQIEEVHGLIRDLLTKSLGQGLAQQCRILYGGSVNAQNIGEITAKPNVDGALVGGASLQAESFLSMVEASRDVR